MEIHGQRPPIVSTPCWTRYIIERFKFEGVDMLQKKKQLTHTHTHYLAKQLFGNQLHGIKNTFQALALLFDVPRPYGGGGF